MADDEAAANVIPKDDDESAPSNANTDGMVKWRGNFVPKEEAKALRHVFDELKDHFGHQKADPMVRVNVASLEHPGSGPVWRGNLDFTYQIDGEHCNLGFIGMDVCVDLIPKRITKDGELLLKDYGKTWIYVYLPQETLNKFKQYVKTGTGWSVSTEGTVEDHNRDLAAIEAKLHHLNGQPKPSFWVAKDRDASIEDMSFARVGSVQEVNESSEQQRVHRGIGIFSVTMEVEGTPNFKPTPGSTRDEVNLCFTLVSVRTWGITDCVAPIVHAPSKWF
eukprot:CAMPEP_0201703654 /NCGR_PEP_ID=MMETSP0578-20130828/40267_1 /ASSEMBLY_ACC=CAM_ASM_000663 /TAXON_ID=267565 /ORGANISM="Skeletonema grethea, Strain CCMP 1804" /LENGTH=276 /DNA_ID=CAMNT_0048191481 /DNA_START=75 /DNA_END=905 /DNA_ORIENTATION=-